MNKARGKCDGCHKKRVLVLHKVDRRRPTRHTEGRYCSDCAYEELRDLPRVPHAITPVTVTIDRGVEPRTVGRPVDEAPLPLWLVR